MKLPIDAVKTREGAAYLGGAAVVAAITLGIFIDTVNDYQAQEARTEATRAFLSGRNDARERLLEHHVVRRLKALDALDDAKDDGAALLRWRDVLGHAVRV